MRHETIEQAFHRYEKDGIALEKESQESLDAMLEDVVPLMRTQPQQYVWWAMLANIATAREKKLKACVEVTGATLNISLRENPQTKVTEPLMKSLVESNPDYQKTVEAYLQAAYLASKFRSIEEGMSQRKDMLQSINARQCREFVTQSHS